MQSDEPIHDYFSLSYAHYLVLPRCALQTMSAEWQQKFVDLLEEMEKTIDEQYLPDGGYKVTALCRDGETELDDPYQDYERGRRRLKLKPKEATNAEND